MRFAVLALALVVAGCAALPPEIRIRFPDWMRGQGVGAEQKAESPGPATAAAPVAASTQTFAYPTGAFPTVHAQFSEQVARRYGAGPSQAAIVSQLTAEGFRCAADPAGQQVCERAQSIGQGCEDVFVVTARVNGGGIGDVRRRCPVGVVFGAPIGL